MKKLNIKTLLVSLLLAMVLGLSLATGCIEINQPDQPEATGTPNPISPGWTPPAATGQSITLPGIADVVALVKPAVVSINTEIVTTDIFNRSFTQEGAGSGWVIDSDGIVVTNYHVVEGAQTITVTTDDGNSYDADMSAIAYDDLNDLAILKINATDLPALKRGDTSNLRVGDWVIAIGNALGQGIRATEGIISRKGVTLPVDQGQTLYDLLETSAAINPGNSGGPLVNLAGEVVGITSAKVAQVGVEGMGYAISIDTAVPIIEDLVNKGYVSRAWLGVSLYTVDQMAVSQFGLAVNEGVLIVEVVSGSPADQAGLKTGDVITGIGGKNVSTVQELTRVLHTSPVGEALEIVYWRGNSENTTTAYPIERPRP